jgi:hypothetical protein
MIFTLIKRSVSSLSFQVNNKGIATYWMLTKCKCVIGV